MARLIGVIDGLGTGEEVIGAKFFQSLFLSLDPALPKILRLCAHICMVRHHQKFP
ncbi:hypothetical protein N9I75_01305 [Alphaproteobacteria bacterium]|nr:hypothetical protein [Alphaproteobacteria bacterium]